MTSESNPDSFVFFFWRSLPLIWCAILCTPSYLRLWHKSWVSLSLRDRLTKPLLNMFWRLHSPYIKGLKGHNTPYHQPPQPPTLHLSLSYQSCAVSFRLVVRAETTFVPPAYLEHVTHQYRCHPFMSQRSRWLGTSSCVDSGSLPVNHVDVTKTSQSCLIRFHELTVNSRSHLYWIRGLSSGEVMCVR